MNGGIAVLTVIASVAALYLGKPFLFPVVLGLLLSFLLRPVVTAMARLKLPRWAGALAALVAVLIVAFSLLMALLPWASTAVSDLPRNLEVVEERLSGISEPLSRFSGMIQRLGDWDPPADDELQPVEVEVQSNDMLASVVGSTGSVLVGLLLSLVLAFFLVVSDERVLLRAARLMPGMADRERATHALRQLESEISRYLITLTLINTVVGLAMTAAAWALGVPEPWVMGLIAGLLNYVPYLGALAAIVLIAFLSLVLVPEMPWALAPPLAFMVINTLEAYILSPLVYGERLRLNPVAILVGLAFFSWIWGVPGAILAVPLLVCIRVTCQHVPRWESTAVLLGPVKRRSVKSWPKRGDVKGDGTGVAGAG